MAITLSTEFELPSRGKCYKVPVQWKNQIKAPRLKDKPLGETGSKSRLQAKILDKTIVDSLGISAYDLHPADFVYLNLMQRLASKGNIPYKIGVKCSNPKCGLESVVEIYGRDIEVKPLVNYVPQTYILQTGEKLTLDFMTPRLLDEVATKVKLFLEEYPSAEGDIETQEYLRSLISKVNDEQLTPPQMTELLQEMLLDDVQALINLSMQCEWGLSLYKTHKCKCGTETGFIIPV